MNVVVHHPNLTARRHAPTEWRHSGAAIVISARPGDVPKIWEADDWQQLVEDWSRGMTAEKLEEKYEARGYPSSQVMAMRALLYSNAFILPPIDRALFVLGGLGRRDDAVIGGFTLCQRPARAAEVIYAANRVLGALRIPPIKYPSVGGSGT